MVSKENLDLIKQEMLDEAEDYLITVNGEVVSSSNKTLSTDFSKDADIRVIHIIDKDTVINYNFQKEVSVKLREVFYSIAGGVNVEVTFSLGKEVELDYVSLRRNDEGKKFKFDLTVNQAAKSNFNYVTLAIYNSDNEITEKFNLDGKNANLELKNVVINTSGSTQNIDYNIFHNDGDTESKLLNYGISKNVSHLTINSRGLIVRGAHKSIINQRTKGLILDNDSEISANPLLEIDDFDVIANHGASIGAIDEAELYYLMSRGISKADAEKLIIHGFVSPVLDIIKGTKLFDYAVGKIDKSI